MTLENFKTKWKDDVEKGIVNIGTNFIIADRFNESNGTFLCEREHLNKIQADLRRMNYYAIAIGVYIKKS